MNKLTANQIILKNERIIKNVKRDLRELNLSNAEVKSYRQIIANAEMAITQAQVAVDNCAE